MARRLKEEVSSITQSARRLFWLRRRQSIGTLKERS
jgi:hypothetical protein